MWVRRLGATASNNTSREAHSQLSSLLDFYNVSGASAAKKDIDWDSHRNLIHTPNVVDNIKAKYDSFMQSEYSVDAAVSRIGG